MTTKGLAIIVVVVHVVHNIPLPDGGSPYFRSVLPFNEDFVANTFPIDSVGERAQSLDNIGTMDRPASISLEQLFDNLYGNSNKTNDTIAVSETTSAKDTSVGFYNTLISGKVFTQDKNDQPYDPLHNDKTLNTGSGLEFKTLNSQTDDKSNVYRSHEAEKDSSIKWSPLTMDPSTIELFLKEQSRAETPEVTRPPPVLSYVFSVGTGTDVREGMAEGKTQESFTDKMNSFGGSYDPNEVNGQQSQFTPDSSFSNFVTQTGSNPANMNMRTNFDADALNREYMNKIADSVFQSPPGVNQAKNQGTTDTKTSDYSYSAYPASTNAIFDASALNQALMNSDQTQGPKGVAQSHLAEVPGSKPVSEPDEGNIKPYPRNTPSPVDASQAPVVATNVESTSRSTQTFDFIPGNLFPGQEHSVVGQSFIEPKANSPPFLRNQQLATNTFNPDLLNAAQNRFNPNSISWIRTRDVEDFVTERESLLSSSVTPTLQQTTTTSSTSKHILTTTIVPASSSSASAVSNIRDLNTSNSVDESFNGIKGFDPNEVNANQGQSLFIPGKMDGYNSAFEVGGFQQSLGFPNTDGNSHEKGNNLSSNINNLKGDFVSEQNTSTNTVSASYQNTVFHEKLNDFNSTNLTENGFGLNFYGAVAFDPNTANAGFGNILNGGFGLDHNENASGVDLGGFNPNAANVGFGNVLNGGFGFENSKNDTGSAFGGFDPNAAGIGFGQSSFGMTSTYSGSKMAGFDPNKMNGLSMYTSNQIGNSSAGVHENVFGTFFGMLSQNATGYTQNSYGSPYIGVFDPDTVNQASFNPDDYNNGRMHLSPVEMLASNPGVSRDTLVAVASAFNPDKVNDFHMQQAISPLQMLLSNPGISRDTLASLGYSATNMELNYIKSNGTVSSSMHSNQSSYQVFDPTTLMSRLMQNAAAFKPGLAGFQQQSFGPEVLHSSEATLMPSTSSGTTSSKEILNKTTGIPIKQSTLSSSKETTSPGPTTTTETSTTISYEQIPISET